MLRDAAETARFLVMKEIVADPIVEEFSARVRTALGTRLLAVYWFGSRARGEGRDDSDYDLLVATRTRIEVEERHKVSDISVGLTGKYRKVLDVHYADEARLHGRNSVLSPFRAHVMAEGVRV
jgi:predicted nucleotidyltransferase